jgi:hypothetical protein
MTALWSWTIRLMIATVLVALAMAAWIVVFLVGLLHPKLTPRRSCDWFREFLRLSGRLLDGLR